MGLYVARCGRLDDPDLVQLPDGRRVSVNPENVLILEDERGVRVAYALLWDAGHCMAFLDFMTLEQEHLPAEAIHALWDVAKRVCRDRGRLSLLAAVTSPDIAEPILKDGATPREASQVCFLHWIVPQDEPSAGVDAERQGGA